MNDTSKSREDRESSHPLADTESNESSDFVDVDALVKGEIDCGIKPERGLGLPKQWGQRAVDQLSVGWPVEQ